MEWFEDETLWRELYPYVFPAERVAAAAAQVAQILALAGIDGGAVLDLCCGPGRHAVEFARRGFAVTGVDRSAFLLERAREKADAAALAVEWVLDDMRRVPAARRPSIWPAISSPRSGISNTKRTTCASFAMSRQSLRDGGTLVMDMVGRERVARQGLERAAHEFADGAVLIQQPRVNEDWTRMHLEWTVAQPAGESRTYRFEHHLYSGPGSAGSSVELRVRRRSPVRGPGGSPYGPERATRLVAVARKGYRSCGNARTG